MRRLLSAFVLALLFMVAWGLISGGGYVLGLALGLTYVSTTWLLVYFMRPKTSWRLLAISFGVFTITTFGVGAAYDYDFFSLLAATTVSYVGCVVLPISFRLFMNKQPVPSLAFTALTVLFPIAGVLVLTYL